MKTHLAFAAAAMSALSFFAPSVSAATYNTLDGTKPIVVAHRGASGYLPEETLGSYELAAKLGADYLEPDLQLTSDGHLVAMHDTTLTRTTNVRELFSDRTSFRVSDFTLAEIKTLTVVPTGALSGADKMPYPDFQPSMADPYKVPTFEEFLDYVKDYNTANGTSIGIYPESKSPFDPVKDQKIIDALVAKGFTTAEDKVILQTFSFESLQNLSDLLSKNGIVSELAQLGSVALQNGVYSVGGATLEQIAEVGTGVGVSYTGITEEFIKAAHSLNLKVHAYTFRPLSEDQAFEMMSPLLAWGLDGFFTDYTDFGRTVVDSMQPAPVPLPAAAPLLLVGLGGLLAMRRRKAA